MKTLHWLWGCVQNKPLEWLDASGRVVDIEHISRRDRLHLMRPMWTHYVLTTKDDCGCRRRFGLWKVIFCSKCVLGEDSA